MKNSIYYIGKRKIVPNIEGIVNRNTYRESLKIAFVTRTSEIFSDKAEGQNRRRNSHSYVEDEFWPDNAVGGNCRCS
jgi:hypothetical protein